MHWLCIWDGCQCVPCVRIHTKSTIRELVVLFGDDKKDSVLFGIEVVFLVISIFHISPLISGIKDFSGV